VPYLEIRTIVRMQAFGTVTTVAGASLVDGETVVLNDGTNPAVTFEFDDDASVVETPTLRAVAFSATSTADAVRDALTAAINAVPTLTITASMGGAATVHLKNRVPGTAGNVAIIETVVAGGFVVTGMAGGANNGSTLLQSEHADQAVLPFSAGQIELTQVGNTAPIAGLSLAARAGMGNRSAPFQSTAVLATFSGNRVHSTQICNRYLAEQLARAVEAGVIQVVEIGTGIRTADQVRAYSP
jgi:hypothetical protein